MKITMKTTLAIACALATGIGAQAQAGTSVPTEVTFKESNATGDAVFKGKVISTADDCVVGRKVKIFRVVPGPNEKIGKEFAFENGKYSAEIPFQSGQKLFAVVDAFETPMGTQCQNDRSPKITVSG